MGKSLLQSFSGNKISFPESAVLKICTATASSNPVSNLAVEDYKCFILFLTYYSSSSQAWSRCELTTCTGGTFTLITRGAYSSIDASSGTGLSALYLIKPTDSVISTTLAADDYIFVGLKKEIKETSPLLRQTAPSWSTKTMNTSEWDFVLLASMWYTSGGNGDRRVNCLFDLNDNKQINIRRLANCCHQGNFSSTSMVSRLSLINTKKEDSLEIVPTGTDIILICGINF